MNFQRKSVLESSQSSDSIDSDAKEFDFLTLKETKEPTIIHHINSKIKSSLQSMADKADQNIMTEADQRIVAGTVIRYVKSE